MKVSSSLLKAMLITASIGVTATGCKTVRPQNQEGEQYEILPAESPSFFDRVKDLLTPNRSGGGDPCPACGMG